MRYSSFLVGIFISIAGPGSAQDHSDDRLEITVGSDQKLPEIVSMQEEGLVLLYESIPGENVDSLYVNLVCYDTLFREKWKRSVGHSKRLNLSRYDYQANQLFLVFQNKYSPTLQLTQIDINGHVRHHVIEYLKHFTVLDFTVFGNNVYLLGELKGVSIAVTVNLENDLINPVPLALLSKHVEVKEVYRNNGFINLVISVELGRQKSIVVREIDESGNRLNDYKIDPVQDYDLLDGHLSYLPGGEKVVLGTYALRKSDNTQGVYLSKFQGQQLLYTRYFSFNAFENFFGYLSKERETKLREEIRRREEKGKPSRSKYRLLGHDVVKRGKCYHITGEAYYPTYRVVRNRNSFGRRHLRDKQTVFDGYRYTHVVMASIHESGQLMWDRSLKIEPTKLFSLRRRVNTLVDQENVYLVYHRNGDIHRVKRSDHGKLPIEEQIMPAPGFNREERGHWNRMEIERWYQNYFLFSGYHKPKNTPNSVTERTEDVLYINKVSF